MNEEELRKFWDRFSLPFVSHYSITSSISAYSLATLLKLGSSKRVLEVGCGGGINAELMDRLSNKDTEFVLCDLSPKMVELAKERLTKTLPHRKIEYHEANAESLSFEDKSFDRYVADYVLHLTTDPEKMLKEAYRVLDDNGIAGFIVWGRKENSDQFTIVPKSVHQVTGKIEEGGRSNFHLQDKEKTRQLILNAGFKKCIAWYSAAPLSVMSGKEYLEHIRKGPNMADLFNKMDEETREKVFQKIIENADEIINRGEPICHEALILVAFK